jgi:O-antigen/teichoic acid export membrane protein
MEHIEAAQQAAEQIGRSTHPIVGKISLVIMVVALVLAKLTLSDVATGIAICSGSVSLGYYIWRWRTEYLEKKRKKK